MSERAETIIDFSDRAQKARVLAKLGALSGPYRLSCSRYRPRRSLKANAYWWAAVVPAFQEFMRGHGSQFDKDEVHEFFLQRFASRPVVDPTTGEVLAQIGTRSSKMDTEQFAQFVNDAAEWMFDKFGIVVPEPSIYRETEQPKHRAVGAGKE